MDQQGIENETVFRPSNKLAYDRLPDSATLRDRLSGYTMVVHLRVVGDPSS
jgi:hypothetical protein